MPDIENEGEAPPRAPSARTAAVLSPTMALVVFGLGLLAGFPIAIFGFDILIDNAAPLFAVLIGLFAFVVLVTVLILAFRRPIWERMFRFGQVEMDRFARPLAEVARYAAENKVSEATLAAQDLAELVLARYSWIITRRWLVATVTAFIAAIAALAGAALLFQQNQLLRVQNERISEQTALLAAQIELGEAQRSTSIVPELLAIGEALGAETAALSVRFSDGDPQFQGIYGDYDLSVGLRARIVAATSAARPYRYLTAALNHATDEEIGWEALARRADLAGVQERLAEQRAAAEALFGPAPESGALIDRAVSPERGQLIAMLYNSRILETEFLTFSGADFSFAEVRLRLLGQMSFQHALLRYADFSGITLHTMDFGAAYLEGARFRRSEIRQTRFSGVPSGETKPPFVDEPSIAVWRTALTGADFVGATVVGSGFEAVNALAVNFDGALLDGVSFADAALGGATFRQAILGTVDFSGADLTRIDLSGAIVFSQGFLDELAAAAHPGSFGRAQFGIEAISPETLAAHPRGGELWRTGIAEDAPAYRIVLVEAFG